MKKITLLFSLLCFTFTFAQVGISENFDAGTPAGWTDTYTNSAVDACAGNTERDNLYSFSTSGNLTSPNLVGASNGTDLDISFDYKIEEWNSQTAQGPGWGTAELQYSTDDGTNWTTVLTIDDTNHVVSNTCATMMVTIPGASLPNGSDVKLRILNTWAAGDYDFHVDNFNATQPTSNPPACTTLSNPANGATDVLENTLINWNSAAGVPTGYFITIGTTSGGNDVADNVDVGLTTSYDAGVLAYSTTYYVTITPYNANGSATGCTEESFTTRATPPPGEACSNPVALTVEADCGTATPYTIDYSTAPDLGTTDLSCDTFGVNTGTWFTFTSPASGLVNVNTSDTNEILVLEASCTGTEIICNGTTSNLNELTLTPNTVYYLAVWKDSATTGTTDVCLSERVCNNPSATTTIVNDCGNGQFSVDVNITSLGDATSVTISNDAGVAATTGITATGVQTVGPFPIDTFVVLTIEHEQNSICNVDLAAVTDTCPPANDDFANAAPIDCSSGTILGSTVAATLDEDNAPDGGGADMDAPNVWFSLDSSVDGPSDVTLDLCGSSYDTSVLIYTGTSGNLTFVAGNDDNTAACGQCCQSLVTFPTDGTSTYYIAVEGYNVGSVGDFSMVVSCVTATPPPANDECANAVPLTTGVTVSGTTVGATTSPGDAPTCDTFGSIADVWYSVDITGGTSDLSITTTITGTSDQANVALYDDCGALAANSLGCSDANGGETLNVTGLAVGTYYVRVWSDGNAPPTAAGRVEGTFDIVVNATLSTGSFESEAAFTYYPNPVQNTLTLNAQNTIENVTMYNILGQEVLKVTPNTVNSELDMSNLQDGAYFVKVTIADVTQTIKVIKQ